MTNDKKLSPHVSLFQLTRTDHADLQEENRHVATEEEAKLGAVASLLEVCQVILGRDLDIHSGRRFLALNKRVGGSERSQHLKCEAADFSPAGPDTQESIDAAFDKLVAAAKEGRLKFGQLIVESSQFGREGKKFWLHISLGAPYRDKARCGEALRIVIKDGKAATTLVAKIA